jgi:hypothetical protein
MFLCCVLVFTGRGHVLFDVPLLNCVDVSCTIFKVAPGAGSRLKRGDMTVVAYRADCVASTGDMPVIDGTVRRQDVFIVEDLGSLAFR